jgi:hypothetical protein
MKISYTKTLVGFFSLSAIIIIQNLNAITPATWAIDTCHYYQAPAFHGRSPVFDDKLATIINLSYTTGSAKRGRNNDRSKVYILDMYVSKQRENFRFSAT